MDSKRKKGNKGELSQPLRKKAIIEAIRKNGGLEALKIVKALGVPSSTYYLWRSQDAEFDRAIVEAMSSQYSRALVDLSLNSLMRQVSDGNTTATMFVLNNLGKDYGFGANEISIRGADGSSSGGIAPIRLEIISKNARDKEEDKTE